MTTTNFGWDVPADTDLVKDGALAMRTLGQDIDTSMADLLGGTSGQVLAKNSNTDMDFAWVTPDDANAIQNAIVDAKGDLIAATAADTPARLAVGTNGYVLTADSAEATGLKWAAAAGGYTPTLTLLNPGGTSLSGSTTTVSGISGKQWLYVVVQGASLNTASTGAIALQINTDTGSNYWQVGYITYASQAVEKYTLTDTFIPLGLMSSSSSLGVGSVHIFNANATTPKPVLYIGDATARSYSGQGYYSGTSAVSSISITTTVGAFDAGTVYVYGA